MNLILSPLISEKSMNDISKNRYTFRVARSATKNDLKKEIEKRFKVNVLKISTVTTKGKSRSVRTKTKISQILKQPFKKAVVTLKAGQKISLFEQGGQK